LHWATATGYPALFEAAFVSMETRFGVYIQEAFFLGRHQMLLICFALRGLVRILLYKGYSGQISSVDGASNFIPLHTHSPG
jgi:hypothetical protein